ncbi:11055_t:CDS:2, partial [Diversispora eburnea]
MSNSFTLRNDAFQTETDPEYCYVIALMNAKLSNPYDNQIFINFYEASLKLILRRTNRSPSQHLLCTSELEDIVIEMMPLFSLDTPDYRVARFRCIFENQLKHCFNCVLTYHKKIRFFIQRWKQIYDPSSVDLYSNHLEDVYATRIRNGLVELKAKLLRANTLDPSQLLGIVNLQLNTDNSTALFEILVYPKALQHGTVNKLFVEILLILLQRENLPRPTNRFLPGIFIASLHENLEIQNWAWSTLQNIDSSLNFNEMMEGDFESVIHSVLSFIVEFFRQTGAFYTQYPFTNNHALIWKGIEMMLSKMEEDVIAEYFITKQQSIIIACNNYLSKPTELGFVEMINCLNIILDKLKEKFWRLISSQITYFVQRIFDAFFFITKASPITPLFCQSLILSLNTLRNSYPKKQPTLIEQGVGDVIHDEFIWLTILRENVSTVCDIYCFIGKMDYVDSLSKLDYQLRFSVWRNIFKYASENILDHLELRSHTIVSFIECFNKIAIMDDASDLNNRGTNQNSNVALLSAFNLSILNIKCITLRFLEKIQMMNTQKLKTFLPVHIASFSIIHFLASPDLNIRASGLLFLKKLYFSNSYYEMIKENTEATILGLISVTTSFIQWTDVGCDTLKLANNIKTLLCEFIPLIFGEKCIFKDKPYFQNFKILTMQFWDILWVKYYKIFQLCKKWDRFGIITRNQEIKILLSEYLKIATITLMSHENYALEFSDSLYDLQMRYFSLLCVILDSNDKDLLNIAAQESTKVLEFLSTHNIIIETKLYVKLENFLIIEENNELNEKGLKEFTQALNKHTPKFPGIKSFESFELINEELLDPDCDVSRSLGNLEEISNFKEQKENDISKGSSIEIPVDYEQFENNSLKTAFPNYTEIVQSSSLNPSMNLPDKEIMEDNPSPSIFDKILDFSNKKIAEKQTFELENSAQVEKINNSSKGRQRNIPKTFQISNEKAISISTKSLPKIQVNTSQKLNTNMSRNERKYSPIIINSIELDKQ